MHRKQYPWYLRMPAETFGDAIHFFADFVQLKIQEFPGMPTIVSYVKNSYQNDPFRVGLEALLVFFTFKYLVSKPKQKKIELCQQVSF